VNTKGYGGRDLSKTILVHTDDPVSEVLQLKVKGKVTRFATIRPPRIRMTGAADQEIVSKVVIVPEERYPFKILGAAPAKQGNIRVDYVEEKTDEGVRYVLSVFNLRKEKDRYFDTVVVKTDSAVRPELKISVYGNILDTAGVKKKSS
jgi:hypothetical protein